MQWYYIVLIFLLSVGLSVLISIPIYFVHKTIHPFLSSRQEIIDAWKRDRFYTEYDKNIRKAINFKMNDGYIINGDYILAPGSKKFVVCVHGYTTNREAEMEYAHIFLRLGFSVIIYDQRGHGDNAPSKTMMGKIEALDLSTIIDQVYEKFGADIKIGLHGVSMGAATIMLVTKYRQDFMFIIEDCGYIDFKSVVRKEVSNKHLPSWLFSPLIFIAARLVYHFNLNDASIKKDIKNIKVPTLIFHGTIDESVVISNAYYLNDNLECKHKLVEYRCKHANSLSDNREDYEKQIKDFIKELNL